jgi:hypothetical protein
MSMSSDATVDPTPTTDDTEGGGQDSSSTGDEDLPSGWTRKGGTLSIDAQGWTNNPSIAAGPGGSIVVAWLQHRNPSVWELSGVRVKQWSAGTWVDLGGRLGHLAEEPIRWPSAYDPSVAVVDGTIYVAWYEGGGYGWSADAIHATPIFVAHWDGATWVPDPDAGDAFGALNAAPEGGARNPQLAEVDGVLHAAWIEHLPGAPAEDTVVVKRLDGGTWSTVGTPWSANASGGRKIIDVAMAGIGGAPIVAWTELRWVVPEGMPKAAESMVHVARWDGGAFGVDPDPLQASGDGLANYVAIAGQGDQVHVAWQEKSPTGNYQLHARHWIDGASALNLDADQGEAGRPALAASGDRVVLAWAESPPGVPAQLLTRSWDGAAWSEPSTSLNMDRVAGSAGSPALTVVDGVAQVAWVEKDFESATKQIYVAGNDDTGDDAAVALVGYGQDGAAPRLEANTWTRLGAGGITDAADGVGDEGYSSINYVAAAKRSVVFGKYHAVQVSWGEDQNALLGYDFARNRWDIVEITENAWSEHLPGIGHDEGNVTVDSERGVYLTYGNLTLNGGTGWSMYAYDLLAGRGKRLMPGGDGRGSVESTGAFDSATQLAYMHGQLYDVATNTWQSVEGCPGGGFAAAAFDAGNAVFVQFGGQYYNGPAEARTWWVDVDSRTCQEQLTAMAPPGGYAHMAYDSTHGAVLVMSGTPLEMWAYDVAENAWTQLGPPPADFPGNAAGQKLTYDSDADVLLWHDGVDLANLHAFRYVP